MSIYINRNTSNKFKFYITWLRSSKFWNRVSKTFDLEPRSSALILEILNLSRDIYGWSITSSFVRPLKASLIWKLPWLKSSSSKFNNLQLSGYLSVELMHCALVTGNLQKYQNQILRFLLILSLKSYNHPWRIIIAFLTTQFKIP